MANNYEAIATVTVGSGGAADIEFTSIPGTYTDLAIKLSVRTGFAGVADDMLLTLNGSASGFSNRYIYGNGSSVFSATAYGNLVGNPVGSTATANTFSNIEIYFPNYASSNEKSYSVDSVSENNATAANAFIIAGKNTTVSAITSLSVAGSSNFVEYSTATLYGIKNS
jgi:hypothetical protein